MKKIIILIFLFLSVYLVEAAIVSLNVSWQLSNEILRPNSETIISLTLTNAGTTDITSIIVTPTPGPYLRVTSGSKLELGALKATTSQQGAISIKVREDATSTTSYVLIDVEYYDGTSSYKKSFYIPITIRREPILEISNVKYSDALEPGKTLELSFDITNSGDGPAKDLKIILGQSDLFTTTESSGEIIVKSLEPNNRENIRFNVTINPEASVGISSMPVELSYYDETKSNVYSETKSIGLTISGNADFVVTTKPGENFYYGSVGSIEISISNRGSAPAEYLTVKAQSNFGTEEFYIGSLDSDDSETIELVQDLRGVSEKYPISLEISYKDKFQNSYSVTKTVEAVPRNAPLDYTIVIVVLVLIGAGVWYYRKRKK